MILRSSLQAFTYREPKHIKRFAELILLRLLGHITLSRPMTEQARLFIEFETATVSNIVKETADTYYLSNANERVLLTGRDYHYIKGTRTDPEEVGKAIDFIAKIITDLLKKPFAKTLYTSIVAATQHEILDASYDLSSEITLLNPDGVEVTFTHPDMMPPIYSDTGWTITDVNYSSLHDTTFMHIGWRKTTTQPVKG